MARRRQVNVFGLAFLDAITCGFGAVVLFYMVINASAGVRAGRLTSDLAGEVDRLDREVLAGRRDLVELRDALREVEARRRASQELSQRLLQSAAQIRTELATTESSTAERRAHVERLKRELKSLEEGAQRLAAASARDDAAPEPATGDRVRAFVGDGDRQYLTGLRVGGERILILVDSSASMLDETVVNVIRYRNLPDARKVRAAKWQRTVATVDWLAAQLPRDSHFQLYTFNETARAVLPDTAGSWLPSSDREVLDRAVAAMRRVVPQKGTSLFHALGAVKALRPAPDNLILLVDGLPTRGATPPRGATVSGKERLKHFERAILQLPPGLPVNVILFPMEGDPLAASAFWKLAISSRGSFLCPSKDWP